MLAFELKELVLGIISGDTHCMSRALSLVERNNDESAEKLLKEVYPYGGNSRIIGITGSTGVGKSSLIHQAAKALRKRNKSVGVIAIDPSSPITNGAFLGDRLRMQDLTMDSNVFIRSVAGGRHSVDSLSKKIFGLAHVMEASGKHYIFIETMGSGQDDCLISKVAQTTVYVTIPTLGDEIQAMKAGILEVSDIVVVNKADDPNRDKAITWWKNVFALEERKTGAWKTPVLPINSTTGEGVDALLDSLEHHERHMKDSGEWERRKKDTVREEVRLILLAKLWNSLADTRIPDSELGALIERRADPLAFTDKILKKKKGKR